MYIAKYLFIQLSELEQRRVNKLSQCLTRQHMVLLSQESDTLATVSDSLAVCYFEHIVCKGQRLLQKQFLMFTLTVVCESIWRITEENI